MTDTENAAPARPAAPAFSTEPRTWRPHALSALIATTALGVLLVAVAYDGARQNRSWSDPLFWFALLVVFLPPAFRLTGRRASRVERIWLVILVGLALYAVKVLLEPHGFTLHDELGQYRSEADIARTGRLYVHNPVVPAYAFYPGLLSVTAALSRVSGLGIFASGVVIIAVARVLLVAGLFLLLERVTDSSWIAGIATLVYATNPNFVYFDAQVAYESLALGLGAVTLWVAGRVVQGRPAVRAVQGRPAVARAWVVAVLLDAALVLTHHLTSYAVAITILLWAVVAGVRRRSLRGAAPSLLLAAFSVGATAAYAAWAWPATQSDIGGSITGSIHGLITVITGQVAGKHPFSGAVGYSNPLLEQVVGLLSVGLLLVALPWGLYALWRRVPRDSGALILGGSALFYPVSLALRLTATGSETSNRTSEFLFVGLGTILAIAFVCRLGTRVASGRITSTPARLTATVYVGLVFVGGITVGNPLYQLLPGSFQVAAANRSVDLEGVAAARWASRLPPGAGFLADENDQELFAAYSRMVPQRGVFDGTGIGSIFTSPTFGPVDRQIIKFDKLHFLVVDKRDSTALPASGDYFGGADPSDGYAHPIPLAALTKFGHAPCIEKIFSSRHIIIYSTKPLLDGCT